MHTHASTGHAAVHLVNPLWDPHGGADRRTVDTWSILRQSCDAQLWTEYEPAAHFALGYPLRRIRPLRMAMPFGGTIVFVGVYFRIGHWIRIAQPARVIVIYNTDQPDRLQKNLQRIAGCGTRADVVVTSPALNRRLGARLPILESPVDVAPFLQIDRPSQSHSPRPFTVGRLSRDDATKHHDDDPRLYRRLAAAGVRVRIMGGTCLAPALQGVAGIELLPAGAESPAEFLGTLDCFVYRTSATWFEGFGRVVFEAMASGLPVVCAREGGYVDYLRHGHDSLVFDGTEEAYDGILRLRDDGALRRALGSAASATAQGVVGEALSRRTRELLAPSPCQRDLARGGVPARAAPRLRLLGRGRAW